MSWVYLVHPDTGGSQLVPDDPSALAVFEARGWEKADLPAALDPDAINEGTTFELAKAEALVEDLKGDALNEALKDAGLPKSGTADEKRARLAEHEATDPANPTQEGDLNDA